MSKQKKFTTAEEILREIERKRSKIPVLLNQAEQLEREARNKEGKLFFVEGDVEIDESGGAAMRAAKRKRRSAFLIETEHVPALKRALAAFQTQTFSFAEDDSVVLEK